jgi:hypothetical protein
LYLVSCQLDLDISQRLGWNDGAVLSKEREGKGRQGRGRKGKERKRKGSGAMGTILRSTALSYLSLSCLVLSCPFLSSRLRHAVSRFILTLPLPPSLSLCFFSACFKAYPIIYPIFFFDKKNSLAVRLSRFQHNNTQCITTCNDCDTVQSNIHYVRLSVTRKKKSDWSVKEGIWLCNFY